MKVIKHNERGAFAIDAVIGMTFFMIAILAIMFMALIIRVQANMQYALGQTAKEISGYYYVVDKLGIASIGSNLSTGDQKKNVEQLNNTIGTIVDFSNSTTETIGKYDFINNEQDLKNLDFDELKELANNASADVTEIKNKLGDVSSSIEELTKGDNPKQTFMAVLQIFGRSFLSKGLSYVIAPMLCKALMPKYMTSGSADEYYKSVGIDPDSVNFSKSELMIDGRSIKLVAEYTLNTKMLTMGMVDMDMHFRQVAATAAWVRPNETGTIISVSAVKGK